jgi:hypothetical protein
MTIENALTEYFKWYENAPEEELPQTPIIEDSDPLIYVGNVTDGWIKWKPTKKEEFYDFREFEEKLDIKLHESIKEYYNSYWFCSLLVEYQDFEIEMNPVVPGRYIRDFLSKFLGYSSAHEGSFDYVPIGFDTNSDFLIVVDNKSGIVRSEDYNNHVFADIASSICELLENGN